MAGSTDADRGPSREVVLIGFEADEAARLSTALAAAGHRALSATGPQVAQLAKERRVGAALANLEAPFNKVVEVIEALRDQCPLLGVGSVAGAVAMTDTLRALRLQGLLPPSTSAQELVYYVNAVLHPDGPVKGVPRRRVPVDLPAALEGPRGPAGARVLNLSETGAFVTAPVSLPENAIIELRFELGPGTEPITARCRVVWVSDPRQGRRYFEGMGLEFVEMPETAHDTLRAFMKLALAVLDQES
jgi:hypothetical protein